MQLSTAREMLTFALASRRPPSNIFLSIRQFKSSSPIGNGIQYSELRIPRRRRGLRGEAKRHSENLPGSARLKQRHESGKTDRKGQIIKYNYDNFHRLFRKTYPDSSTVEYTYEGMRLKQVVDASGTYTFAYDDMDRLKTATVSYTFLPVRTFTVNYTYDKAGNRKTMTDPESGVATYTYDAANRLTGLQDFQLQNYTLGYSAVNSRLSLARPNSVATTYTYDNIQRLTGVTHKLGTTVLDGAGEVHPEYWY